MFRVATGTLLLLLLLSTLAPAQNSSASQTAVPTQYNEWTIAQMQAAMDAGTLTSANLTQYYITRILDLDQAGPGVNSIIELNPDALAQAKNADALRRKGFHSAMLGIPIVLKDNIGTADKMQTSAGSFALVGQPAVYDSTVAANLRAAGAVILGKTNLSEWANFRSFESTSGWSGRGGQTNNAYGINRNPCGSSSGSGAATSANFAAVALATETDGSVVCPANANGVAAIKPTVGLTSRWQVVPISHTQDTVGVHGRTVADAAAVLGVIQSRTSDGHDAATGSTPLGWQVQGLTTRPANIPTDYTQFVNPNGLKGARLGLTRGGIQGFDPFFPTPQPIIDAFNNVVAQLQAAGATIIDLDAANVNFAGGNGEFEVLCYDFKNDIKSYLSTRVGVPAANGTLDTLIAFDAANAAVEEPFFNDDIFGFCNGIVDGADTIQPQYGMSYNQALAADGQLGVSLDTVLQQYSLDAIVAPTDNPAWPTDQLFGDRFYFGTSGLAAPEGYPIVQVPAAVVYGLPMGLSFFGTAFSEPKLISLASGFEAATHVRAHNLPTLAPMTPSNNIQGTTPTATHSRSATPKSSMPKGTMSTHPM